MYLQLIAIIILIFGAIVFLKMYLLNRPVRSFLYFSIFSVLAAMSFIFKKMELSNIGFFIFAISQFMFLIGCIRSMTIESGYFNHLKQIQKSKPLIKRFSFRGYFVELKEINRNSKKTGIKWGLIFISLYFISILVLIIAAAVMGINIKEIVIGISLLFLATLVLFPYTLLLGIGLIYYSKKYLKAD